MKRRTRAQKRRAFARRVEKARKRSREKLAADAVERLSPRLFVGVDWARGVQPPPMHAACRSVVTVNEQRAEIGLPAIPDGDRTVEELAADAARRLGPANASNMTAAEIAEAINAGDVPDGVSLSGPVVACVVPARAGQPESVLLMPARVGADPSMRCEVLARIGATR